MSDLTPKVGVWRSLAGLANYKAKNLLWPEGGPALLLGAGGAFALAVSTAVSDRMDLMGTILQLAGAFLAVVFTALAIMVALPSGRYLSALQEDDEKSDGMARFLAPFLVAVGTQIAVLLIAIAYGLVADQVSRPVERVAFCLLGFLFVYGLLDIVGLARALVKHGILRARDAVRDFEEEDKVRSLHQRRSGS